MKTIGLFGCGFLNNIVADCYNKGLLKDYKIIGCYSRTLDHAKSLADKVNAACCQTYDDLLALFPDFILEATNPEATKEILIKTLKNGSNIVLLSIGALEDEEFYQSVKECCGENNTKVYLASGAIGGFDILRTATIMGATSSKLINTKGPRGLLGTELFNETMLLTDTLAFSGKANEAIKVMPTRINVGVATALTSLGINKTDIIVQTKPNFVGDEQRIEIEVPGEINAVVDIYSRTSSIAGYSVVALLQRLAADIVF